MAFDTSGLLNRWRRSCSAASGELCIVVTKSLRRLIVSATMSSKSHSSTPPTVVMRLLSEVSRAISSSSRAASRKARRVSK